MKKDTPKPENCKCPYCEEELKMSCFEPTFCNPCNIKLIKCKKCGEILSEKLIKCSKCGKAL